MLISSSSSQNALYALAVVSYPQSTGILEATSRVNLIDVWNVHKNGSTLQITSSAMVACRPTRPGLNHVDFDEGLVGVLIGVLVATLFGVAVLVAVMAADSSRLGSRCWWDVVAGCVGVSVSSAQVLSEIWSR